MLTTGREHAVLSSCKYLVKVDDSAVCGFQTFSGQTSIHTRGEIAYGEESTVHRTDLDLPWTYKQEDMWKI